MGATTPPALNPFRKRRLERDDDAGFNEWYRARADRLGLSSDPNDPQHFYDYRAAFRAGAEPDASGHWPSEFKRPGHPNLIAGGVDARTGEPVREPANPFRGRRRQSQGIREMVRLPPLLRGIEEARRAEETPGLRARRRQLGEAKVRERHELRERTLLPVDVPDLIVGPTNPFGRARQQAERALERQEQEARGRRARPEAAAPGLPDVAASVAQRPDVTGVAVERPALPPVPRRPTTAIAAAPAPGTALHRLMEKTTITAEEAEREARALEESQLIVRALGRDVGARFLLKGAQKFADWAGGPLGLEAHPILRNIVETADRQRAAEDAGEPHLAARLSRDLITLVGEFEAIPGATAPSRVPLMAGRGAPRVLARAPALGEAATPAVTMRPLAPGFVGRAARRSAEDAARFGLVEGVVGAVQEKDPAAAAERQRRGMMAGAVFGPAFQGAGELVRSLGLLRLARGAGVLAPPEIAQAARATRAQAERAGRFTRADEEAYARQVLGVGENATEAEISAAFQGRVVQRRPDGALENLANVDPELFKVYSEAIAVLRRRTRPQAPRGAAAAPPPPAAEATPAAQPAAAEAPAAAEPPVNPFRERTRAAQAPPEQAPAEVQAQVERAAPATEAGPVNPFRARAAAAEAQPAPAPEPIRPAAVGQAAAVVTPQARHPVQYALVEADQLVPSHRPETFERDPRYPAGVQERPYERDPSEQMKVVRHAQQFEPQFILTDDPTAVNGPPIVTPSGLVLGGNSRTMTMQRLYSRGEGDQFREALIERAAAFGLDPETVRQMKQPVLVRVLDQEPGAEQLPELVRQFNEVPTQELGTAAGAVAQARRMSSETISFVGESLEPTETIAAWLDRPTVQRDLIQRFLNDAVFTSQTVNRYVTQGTLNKEGRQFVERVLLGAVIPDAAIIESAPAALLQKVSKVIGPVSQAAAVAPEWDVRALLTRALELGRVAEQQGLTPDDLASQYDLMGAEVEPEAVQFLQLLRSESAAALRQRFARYAAAARRAQPAAQGQVELEVLAGAPPTPAQALAEAFGIQLPEAGGTAVRFPAPPYEPGEPRRGGGRTYDATDLRSSIEAGAESAQRTGKRAFLYKTARGWRLIAQKPPTSETHFIIDPDGHVVRRDPVFEGKGGWRETEVGTGDIPRDARAAEEADLLASGTAKHGEPMETSARRVAKQGHIDDVTAKRLGFSKADAEGINRLMGDLSLIHEEGAWRKAVTTERARVVVEVEGRELPGTIIQGAEDPVNGVGKAGMALVEHRMEGQLVQRWYPATQLRPAAEIGSAARPALGLRPESEGTAQQALFGERAGTAASRSLSETEAAARSALPQLREELRLTKDPQRRAIVAGRIATLEKLVNRGRQLTAEELQTQALAGTEGEAPPHPEQGDLFVREAVADYLKSVGDAHIKQVFGSQKVAEGAAESGARADRAVPTFGERRQVIAQKPKTWVDIRGKRLASKQDVRDVIGPFRQPDTEIMHWSLTDADGVVKAHAMESSGAIDHVRWSDEQLPRLIYEMIRRAERVGATEIHAVHNHPGGDSEPSKEDLAITVKVMHRLQRAGSRLRLRHWVIDNDNVSEIRIRIEGIAQLVDETSRKAFGLSSQWLGSRELWHVYMQIGKTHARKVKSSVTPAQADQPDWTEHGAGIVTSPQDVVQLAGRPPVGRVDVLYRATNGSIVAAAPHSLDAALHPERWLDAEARSLGAYDAFFVLDAGPEGAYRQVHAAVEAFQGATPIRDIVGLGGEGQEPLSAQAEYGYRPWRNRAARGHAARGLREQSPDYGPSGHPASLSRAEQSPAEVGEAAARPAPAESGRLAEEPPSYEPERRRESTPLRRWLDAVREGRAFTGRPEAQMAPDIGETGASTEALPVSVSIAGTAWTLRPIAPVELVRMARELLGSSEIFLRKYPSARGMFYGIPGEPKIGLHPALGRDYEQFARTLAHEVGHLVDFLPEETLQRGNILGRIASLRDYLQSTVDALPTSQSKALTPQDRARLRQAAIKHVGSRPAADNKADLAAWQQAVAQEYSQRVQDEMDARKLIGQERVREELIAVSMWWRPYDPATASPAHVRYRESSPELYADAVSVLLNSPGSLQAKAPTFFESFLAYLERKPEVRKQYQEIQGLLGDEEALMRARREELEADFRLGEAIRQASEQRRARQPFANYLRQLFLTRGAPATKAESRKLGKGVAPWSEQRGVKLALQEFNHGDNSNRLLLMDVMRDVHDPLAKAGITTDQAGRYLLLRRIAEGDRGGMAEQAKAEIMAITGQDSWPTARDAYQKLAAQDPETSDFDADLLQVAESGVLNPHGYTPEEATRTLDALAKELGADKFALLGELTGKLRSILAKPTDDAVRLGVYSQEVYDKTILPNRETYVPFTVLDYFNGRVPAGIRRQIGTVKGVANPYASAILKAMALNRLNEYQKAKQALLSILDQFPDVGPEQPIDRFHRERKPATGRANLVYHKNGKLYYREVDEYLVRVLDKTDLGAIQRVTAAFGSMTYRFFHPLYVSWSVAWQMRNLPRDWKRTYKNLAAAHAGKPTYRQAIEMFLDIGRLARSLGETFGAAYAHARRRDHDFIRRMLADKALGRAFHSFEPAPQSETVNRLAQRYGLLKPPPEPAAHRLREAIGTGGLKGAARGVVEAGKIVGERVRRVLGPLETVGVMQETWTKAAAYKLLGRLGISGRQRAYMVRNYSGTPDATDAGLASEAVNALFMYANVISAGWRADFEVATNPRSASGYWMRAMLIDFLPKLLMAAAALGWLGEQYEEWMEHVPSYEKEKYIIVPLPPFYVRTKRGDKKALYLRIPHDDLNRVLAAITWAFTMDERPHAPSRAVGMVAGEFPGVNPGIELPYQWAQFMSNRNPYDAFRGRNVVRPTEWEAGGWARTREMFQYTLGEFGIISQAVDWVGSASGYSLEVGEKGTAERVLGTIPGVSAMIKASDRGLQEERWWEVDWERQRRAALRSDLSERVRRASGERSRLNTLGEDRLSDQERARRNRLNVWYRQYYLPLTAEMELRRDAKDRAGYQAAALRLDGSAEQIDVLPQHRRRQRGPRPPQPPRHHRPR